MSAFSSVSQGLNEALVYAEGKDINATLHQVEVPAVDVCGIRKSTGLSQSDFAKSIGVAKGTLVNWEQGRRHPSGPAQILLALIARKSTVVQDLLTDK